jgi:nicotinamidase/pyrazinamidase
MSGDGRTVFWNVDTQFDFMRPEGHLYVPGAETIEGQLALLTQLARNRGIQTVNTADWHHEKSPEISDKPDFVNTFPRHCEMHTVGSGYVDATAPRKPLTVDWQARKLDEEAVEEARDAKRDLVLLKDAFDIFQGSPQASKVVEISDPKRAVVYGVALNVCVRYAVEGLLDRGIEVYVPMDATKGLPKIPTDQLLRSWEDRGAILGTVEGAKRYVG